MFGATISFKNIRLSYYISAEFVISYQSKLTIVSREAKKEQ